MSRRSTIDTINRPVKEAQYAVRGPIVQRAAELSVVLKDDPSKVPFKQVISCNIGNPHSLEQRPLSFIRDVLSLTLNPELKDRAFFEKDVIQRAETYLSKISSLGAYSESQGILEVREDVCAFLEKRDGYPAKPKDIFLTNGASAGVTFCLQALMREPSAGVKEGLLVPIPQYPLYSALATLMSVEFVPYYLDESDSWNCTVANLDEALSKASSAGITIRALVVINPGNPTGQILPLSTIRDIVKWCKEKEILIMADEVYQANVFKKGADFVSFRKAAMELNAFNNDSTSLQLISFHSISKGFTGECGLRGGYFEILGFSEDVKNEIVKLVSISLCSSTVGQIATGLMVNPPQPGDPSFPIFDQERQAILGSLQRRADVLSKALNQLEGVSCNAIDGAMYAFPTIRIPPRAVAEAEKLSMQPDAFYCLELLESTGIVVVPGSGFGQSAGTWHFRITILPPEHLITEVINLLSTFHGNFLEKYK